MLLDLVCGESYYRDRYEEKEAQNSSGDWLSLMPFAVG